MASTAKNAKSSGAVTEPKTNGQSAPPTYTYYVRHADADAERRGPIDLEAAQLLVRHFAWGVTPIATEPPEDDESSPMITFRASTGPELSITAAGPRYDVDLFLPRERARAVTLKKKWAQRSAASDNPEEVLALVKLFFKGQTRVVDDILRSAELR
jgi:hypothetical protein